MKIEFKISSGEFLEKFWAFLTVPYMNEHLLETNGAHSSKTDVY